MKTIDRLALLGLGGILLGCPLSALGKSVPLADASASAAVEEMSEGAEYRIAVEFVPVTTLDEVSNDQMTEVLARFYAEEALSGFLEKEIAILFPHVQSLHKTLGERHVQWTFSVPARMLVDAPPAETMTRKEITQDTIRGDSPDIQTRLLDFRSQCFKDLRIAEALFADEAAKCVNPKEKAALRNRIVQAFAALEEKVRNDGALFRAEKKELLERAAKVRAFLLDELAGGEPAQESGIRQKDLPISDATFVEPFGAFLRADPILLRTGGVRIIERQDGSRVVLAVGSASAMNEHREDIADAQAQIALAKWREEEVVTESELTREYQRNSNGVETSGMKRTSHTRLSAMSLHKPGETVGTWFSPDGTRFFLAKGRIVSP